jgi:phosphate transport system protein
MPVRKEYIKNLEKLKVDVLRMGELSKESARNAIQALVHRDMELASRILKGNATIDDLEFNIEHRCIKLIALQQPMAVDLRTIGTCMKIITDFDGTCMKIITDFDRISDLAGDIARIVLQIADEPFVKPLIDIPRMSEISQGMISDCLKAFSDRDIKALEDFSDRDDVIDALFDQVRRELMTITIEKPRGIENASHLLFVALHLERVGDHACNIASRIVVALHLERVGDHACNIASRIGYMVTGENRKFE